MSPDNFPHKRHIVSRVLAMHPLAMCAGLCLIAMTIPGVRLLWIAGDHAREESLAAAVHTEADKTRAWMIDKHGPVDRLDDQIGALRSDMFAELASWRQDTVVQVRGLRGDVMKLGAAIETDANARTAEALWIVDKRTGELVASFKPITDNAAALTAETAKTMHDLHPQLLGAVAAVKVTAGETAQTMRTVRDAVPGFVTQGQAIAENVRLTSIQFVETGKQSAETSKQTAKLMANLAKASAPITPWIRIPLQLLGLAAPIASGAVSSAAAAGAFR